MANNHEQFIAFNDKISAEGIRETLKSNREVLRNKIRNYYKENYPYDIQPCFHQQGSYAMHTLLNPIIREDGSRPYDMDDGIYFVGNVQNQLSIQEYHSRILKAVEGHTNKDPEDNDPCVTVYYADGHHVDLPIYFMEEDDEHPQLAHKTLGWIYSDPREFYKWFNGIKENNQLRRLVRYLKAWADYEEYTNGTKMPSGCIMTILAAKYYVRNERDDIAFKDLLVAIHVALNDKFECLRPTFPINEDLFAGIKWTLRKDSFMKALKDFKDDAVRAINSKNPHDACLKWQLHFGNRFCCSSVSHKDEDALEQASAGPKLNTSRYA